MFLIMALLSGDDVCGLSSAWRSDGVVPYSSRKHTSYIWFAHQPKTVVNPIFLTSLLSDLCSAVVRVLSHFSWRERSRKKFSL